MAHAPDDVTQLLAQFPARDVHPLRRALSWLAPVGVYEEHAAPESGSADVPNREPSPAAAVAERVFASDAQRAAARAEGLVRLGSCYEGNWLQRFRKEIWATPDGLVHTHLRRPDRYFFATYFTDGGALLTWSRAQPNTQSTTDLISEGGTGRFGEDLARHRARLQREVDGSRRPVPVNDVRIAVALIRHYYRQLVPLGLAAAAVVPYVLITAALVLWILRSLH